MSYKTGKCRSDINCEREQEVRVLGYQNKKVMDMIAVCQKKLKQNKISDSLCSIILNVIIFSILLILFEPTFKSDDYDMTTLLYGGIDGEYSSFILYIHVFLGYLMKGLLTIFPNISWYYVLGFIGIILSFSVLTFVLIKRGLWGTHKFFITVILFFSGYEFYIRTTFSKTAGIMIVAGLIFLLYLIEEDKNFNLQYIYAIILIVIGTMIRNMMFTMLLGVALSCFIIFCIENRQNSEKLVEGVVKFIILSVFLFSISVFLNKSNSFILNNDENWREYQSQNAARAILFDYSWPEYSQFQEEYERLGVSENDYKMWAELANITDPDIFTPELMKEIRKIQPIQKNEPITKVILKASKSLMQYLTGNLVFYLFLSSCVLLFMIKGKQSSWKILLLFGFCIGVYYYLFFRGRIQHHVDAALFIMSTFLILYYCNKECDEKKTYKMYFPISLIFLSAIFNFYGDITSSSYYGTMYGNIASQKKQYKENYERLSPLSRDKENLYLLGANETNLSYPCFSVFQMMEKGFYSNIYRLNQYTVPIPRRILRNYGIKNDSPLAEITDSDRIYYCVSQSRHFEIDIVEQYIIEHHNSAAKASLVEEINGLYIYRFITEEK